MVLDVFAMCNALHDLQATVDQATLAQLGLTSGSMTLIDDEAHGRILPVVSNRIVNSEAGGSGANTAMGVALLGGTAAYTSRVGRDDLGAAYWASLQSHGVRAILGEGDGPTGTCIVLITPDAQRTMCTYLGQSRELQPGDVDLEALRAARFLYVTGYLWDTDNQKETVLLAMREAHAAGVKIALSLSDMFCVDRNKAEFTELIEKYVDVVFANAAEAQALTGCAGAEESAQELATSCELAVVTMDRHGSLLVAEDDFEQVPAVTVTAIDTTGAGDMYAAGVLYGLTHGMDLARTGRLAAAAAAQVVAKMGPRLESVDLTGL